MISISTISSQNISKYYPSRGHITVQGKIIPIPSVYRGKAITAVFPISYKKAVQLMESPHLKPARLSFTKALLSVTVFDFKESPVGPYAELAYAIPVLYKSKLNLPLLPILFYKVLNNFGYYVLDILQNKEIAVAHGKSLTEYPHNNELIDARLNNDKESVTAFVESKRGNILSLTASKIGNEKEVYHKYMTYFHKGKESIRIQMDVYALESKVRNCRISLGNDQLSEYLKTLDISPKSLQTFFYSDFVEILPVTKDRL